MSELPPEIAVEPEPTDADPPPEAGRPERPRIWPEEPRAPRPQIKRPMEEWLAEFEERGKQVDARPHEPPSRRRRPRGLARIVPVVARPERPRDAAGAETGRSAAPDQQRRGRRRRRSGGGGAAGDRSGPGGQPQQIQGQARPQRGTPRRRGTPPPRTSGGTPAPRPSPARGEGDRPVRPPRTEGDARPPSGDARDPNRRRRRRGRGRGRGPRPNGPPPSGGPPSSGPAPS